MRTVSPSSAVPMMGESNIYRLLSYTPLVGSVTLYLLIVFTVAMVNGLDEYVRIGLYSPLAALIISTLLLWWLWRLIYLTLRSVRHREAAPLRTVRQDFSRIVRSHRLVEILLPVLLISLFQSVFTSFKALIGILNPFYLDPLLAELDHAIHGGLAPWQITHALITTPTGTMAIDLFYTAWFLVMWLFLYWQVLRLDHPFERHQFFLTYVLCWGILGSLFAYLLSSAGPCYFGRLYGMEDLYAPLMDILHTAKAEAMTHGDWRDIRALNGQSYLWSNYIAEDVRAGVGISAMPSMHVSMAVLFALSAWRANRLFGWLMTAYAAVILFGSVHLGWHYATDGYVAIIVTILIWRFSGWILKRFFDLEEADAQRKSDSVG